MGKTRRANVSAGHYDLFKTLLVLWFTPGLNDRWGLPVLFWGKPGIGKSRRIEATAERCGLPMQTLIASIRQPEDFGGFPVPQEKGKTVWMEYAPPGWAADLEVESGGTGVIFIDEITTVEPATQKALLRLVLDGALGDYQLANGLRFVAAGNAVADAVGGWDLAPPVANRFGHMDWPEPSPDTDPSTGEGGWCDWLVRGTSEAVRLDAKGNAVERDDVLDAKALEARVMRQWPNAWAKAAGLVSSFIKARREWLFKMPEAGSANLSRAWPSPRTWEMATRALAGCQVHGVDAETMECILSAFVGAAPITDLVSYMTDVKLPDPADVLDGRVDFEHDKRRLDRTDAVLSSCSALVSNDRCENREARVAQLWEIVGGVVDAGAPDLCVTAGQAAVATKMGLQAPSRRKALSALNPFLTSAGIVPGQ